MEKKKIFVALHLYYIEQWEEICSYLKNLENEEAFDLCVTLQVKDGALEEKIKNSFGSKVKTEVVYIENNIAGADVWPFIHVVNNTNLDNYEIVYKLHTKQTFDSPYVRLPKIFKTKIFIGGDLWRKFLLSEILAKRNIRKVIEKFNDKKVGSVGFMPLALTHINDESFSFRFNSEYKNIKSKDEYKTYKFFAGTIFAIRSDVLKTIQNQYNYEDFIKKSKKEQKFADTAYHFEAGFGIIPKLMGLKQVGVNPFSNAIILKLLASKLTYRLYRWYVDKFILYC